MCKIRLIGLPNEKYEGLKRRVESVIEMWDGEIELVEIKNVHLIVEEKVDLVPAAIFEGEKKYQWNEHTSIEDMLAEIKEDLASKSESAKDKGDCKMRNIDPTYTPDHL